MTIERTFGIVKPDAVGKNAVGGVVDGRVEPSWTMAMFWPLVSFASTAPMRLGLAMKP